MINVFWLHPFNVQLTPITDCVDGSYLTTSCRDVPFTVISVKLDPTMFGRAERETICNTVTSMSMTICNMTTSKYARMSEMLSLNTVNKQS